MTTRSGTVTGPSVAHEERAQCLSTMAALAGFDVEVGTLPDGSRPDAFGVRPTDRAIFIGDAKATETANNAETRRRLLRYAAFVAKYVSAGGTVLVVLAVPDTNDRVLWASLLRDVTSHVPATRVSRGSDTIELAFCTVVWALLEP